LKYINREEVKEKKYLDGNNLKRKRLEGEANAEE
jgi:hypothetical protein